MSKTLKLKRPAPVRVQPVVGRRLAQRIARKLFTPGGERRMVDHLRLMRGEKYICGWAYGPAVDTIQSVIESSND